MSQVAIDSEIGRLRSVIVHEPGPELDTVAPEAAAEALLDDVLDSGVAAAEHRLLAAVLARVARVHRLIDLLADVLADGAARADLVQAVCRLHGCPELAMDLAERPPRALARALIEGVRHPEAALAGAIDPSSWAVAPSPNAFFTRDPAVCFGGRVLVGAMARTVRATEGLILRAVFRAHPALSGADVAFDGAAERAEAPHVALEGGDVLVLRDDLLAIGCGERTSAAGIQRLVESLAAPGRPLDVLVVLLPRTRATIHLDMIVTLVDHGLCVAFEPLVSGPRRCRVVGARIEGGRVARWVHEEAGLLPALARRGMPLEAVPCGGVDPLRQAREQASSGANLFALGPGRVVGYERNRATFEALASWGFRIVEARDVAEGAVDVLAPGRVAVALPDAESSRGGGGCRCMTLPVARDPSGAAR